jgi:hypothetical protein
LSSDNFFKLVALWLRRRLGLAVVLAIGSVFCDAAKAIVNIDANDYVPLPAGTTLLIEYAEYSKNDGLDLGGMAPLAARLDSEVGIFRPIHYQTLFGVMTDAQVVIPVGTINNVEIDGVRQNSSSGAFDPIVGGTIWVVNRPETSTFFALTTLTTLPLGEYRRSDTINLGNNRFQEDLQFGVQTAFGSVGLAKQIVVYLYSDTFLYGANTRSAVPADTSLTQATLTQAATWQLQSWLSYTTQTGTTSLALGYAASTGGRQLLAGVPTGTRTEEQQVRGELQTFVTKHIQLSGEVTHDVHVEGGFRQEVGFNARITIVLEAAK